MEDVKYLLPSTGISRFSTNDESKNFFCGVEIFLLEDPRIIPYLIIE
jgi:hypothetical protein